MSGGGAGRAALNFSPRPQRAFPDPRRQTRPVDHETSLFINPAPHCGGLPFRWYQISQGSVRDLWVICKLDSRFRFPVLDSVGGCPVEARTGSVPVS